MLMDFISWLGVNKPAYIPATITGLFGATGIILSGIAAVSVWAAQQIYLRRQKRNDLRAALRAEVTVLWRVLVSGQTHIDPNLLKFKFEENGQYKPHFTLYPRNEIFDAVKVDVAALGRADIPAIVNFYKHMEIMNSFVMDVRSVDFSSYETNRKIRMTLDLIKMHDQAILFAENAINLLEHLLDTPTADRLCAHKFRLGIDLQ